MKVPYCQLNPRSIKQIPRLAVALCLAITGLVSARTPSAQDERQSLKSELASRSRKDGWALVEFDGGNIYAIPFGRIRYPLPDHKVLDDKVRGDHGVISPDGKEVAFIWKYGESWKSLSHLGIVHADGTDLREFPEINQPQSLCWSHDKSRLVLTLESAPRPAPRNMVIFDIPARTIKKVAFESEATAQCWSPDDQQIV